MARPWVVALKVAVATLAPDEIAAAIGATMTAATAASRLSLCAHAHSTGPHAALTRQAWMSKSWAPIPSTMMAAVVAGAADVALPADQ